MSLPTAQPHQTAASPIPAPANLPARSPRRAVVVLGMHRSGTSAVAGCLQRLGVDFGPRLMPPTSANERGYYEHIDVVNLHDRLLLAMGSSWDETLASALDQRSDPIDTGVYRTELLALLRRDFEGSPLWGIKDPRLCRLLPWWEPLWNELNVRPLFLIVLRSPREIVASLVRREGFSEAKGYLLWLQHLLAAESATRAHERVFLDFEAALADPAAALQPVWAALGGSPDAQAALAEGGVGGSFLDPGLRHARAMQLEGAPPVWVAEADSALRRALSGREGEMGDALDRIREQLSQAAALYEPLLRFRGTDLAQQLSSLRLLTRWYEAEWQKARGRLAAMAQRLQRREPGARKTPSARS